MQTVFVSKTSNTDWLETAFLKVQ